MARRTALITSALLVLFAHAALLHWLHAHWPVQQRLMPMATPMFTRVLQQELPATPVLAPVLKQNRPAARVEYARPTIELIAKPEPSTGALSPTLAPTQAAEAPVPVAASAPQPLSDASVAASAPPATAPADPLASWPVNTRISYRLRGWFRGELHGDAQVQWQREASRYQVRIDIDIGPFVSLRMTSQGQLSATDLMPDAYEELRGNRRRHARLGPSQITFEDGREVARPTGVQDTASQFVALSQRFASGQQALEVGQAVSFWMARPGAVDQWTYDVVERVQLQTPAMGLIDAFHLKPRPIANPRGNITAEMWFAPALQYLPVRIRINQGSEIHLDLLVEKIEQR